MSEQAPAAGAAAGLSGLQKLCLALAAVVTLAGAGLWGASVATRDTAADKPPTAPQSEPADGSGRTDGLSPQGFVEGWERSEPTEDAEGERSAMEIYGPTVFRLGFGFFVGFAIAFAIRAALKLVLLIAGVLLLLLVGLQMAGLISVNWAALEGHYDALASWLGSQTGSLTAFLSGYIPSGGSALAGFGIGMLKKA
jgi:uncharacterized membrane protein (Fun14 family)